MRETTKTEAIRIGINLGAKGVDTRALFEALKAADKIPTAPPKISKGPEKLLFRDLIRKPAK